MNSKLTEHFTREEADAFARNWGVITTKFRTDNAQPYDNLEIPAERFKCALEAAVTAKLKEWEAQGAVGFVMKGREFPNTVFYPASHKPTDINNFDAVYTHALPAQPAEPVNAELVEALPLGCPEIESDWITDNPNRSDLVEYVRQYALLAINQYRAQAATTSTSEKPL